MPEQRKRLFFEIATPDFSNLEKTLWIIASSPGFHAQRLQKAWDAYAHAGHQGRYKLISLDGGGKPSAEAFMSLSLSGCGVAVKTGQEAAQRVMDIMLAVNQYLCTYAEIKQRYNRYKLE